MRLILLAAGIALVAPLFSPSILSALIEITDVKLWWFVMIACGLGIVAMAVGTSWQWTGVLIAALLVGSSAQLALTEPQDLRYFHIRPSSNFDYMYFIAIAVQGAVTLLAFLKRGQIRGTIRFLSALGFAEATLIAILSALLCVTVMYYVANGDLLRFAVQVGVAVCLILLNLATVTAIAIRAPAEPLTALSNRAVALISFPGGDDEIKRLDSQLPRLVALWTFVVAGLYSFFAFGLIPHAQDEVVYLFQARYFLLGQLSVPVPAIADAFTVTLSDVVGDKWYSIMPPGWPAVLAAGTAINLYWLVNPALAAICILLAHTFVCKISDRGLANLVIALMAVSTWYFAISGTLMSHSLTLTLLLASWLLLFKARDDCSAIMAFIAGGLMGFLFLTRFFDGLLMGVLTGIWTLSFLRDRMRWKIIVGYGVGCAAIGALIFPYNQHLTGDALLTTITHYWTSRLNPEFMDVGFGPNVGAGPENWPGRDLLPGHSLSEALMHVQHNSQSINFELFGWSVGSLAPVFVQLFWGRWPWINRYMVTIVAVTICMFSLFWFSGAFYVGARYWFMAFFPLVVLSASGIAALSDKLECADGAVLATQRLAVVIASLCIVSLISFLSWRGVDKYHAYRSHNFHTDYHELVRDNNLDGSLIFVKEGTFYDFSSASTLNTPTLAGPGPIFARDLGNTSNRAVAAAFPDRPIYFVVGRSDETEKAYIARGPVSGDTLQ